MLEAAGDFCVLEPFTHPWGVPAAAALGGGSAPTLDWTCSCGLILGVKRLKWSPSLQLRVLSRRGRHMTDLGHTFNPFFELKGRFYSLICITSPEQGRQRELTTTLKPHQYKSINHEEVTRSWRGLSFSAYWGLDWIPQSRIIQGYRHDNDFLFYIFYILLCSLF